MRPSRPSPGAAHGSEDAVSVRRLVNDAIADAAEWFDEGATVFEFLCECGDLGCRRFVRTTLADYRASTPGSIVCHD